MARSALARTAPCGQVWDTKTSKYPLLGSVWPCFDPFEILAETPSSCNIEGNESPPEPPATRTLEIRCNIDMTAANRHIFGRATRRKPRFLAFPKTPLFNHLARCLSTTRPSLCGKNEVFFWIFLGSRENPGC